MTINLTMFGMHETHGRIDYRTALCKMIRLHLHVRRRLLQVCYAFLFPRAHKFLIDSSAVFSSSFTSFVLYVSSDCLLFFAFFCAILISSFLYINYISNCFGLFGFRKLHDCFFRELPIDVLTCLFCIFFYLCCIHFSLVAKMNQILT